jgi:type II secretory pathway component PulJ
MGVRRFCLGVSLVEILVAVSIFAFTILGFLMGLVYLQNQNRALTQRELASNKALEIIELFKNLDYGSVQNSTEETARFLQFTVTGEGDGDWRIPRRNEWVTLPVARVASASATMPGRVTTKLPEAKWTVDITEITRGSSPSYKIRQIDLTITWRLRPGMEEQQSLSMTTYVAPGFSWL